MKTTCTFLFIIAITLSCRGQIKQRYSKNDLKKISNKNAATLLKSESIHSVAIGVYANGTKFSAYFGELDSGKKNIPNDSTMYSIASITKTMTGFLAAKAVLDKKLKLEHDIRDYLQNSYKNLAYNGASIKIKHLLTHTSGLPAELVGVEKYLKTGDINGALSFVNTYSKSDFFKDLKRIQINEAPGTKYLYSSNGTNLLGYILELVYNKSYIQLLTEYIFEKAKMKHTKLDLTHAESKNLANGYDGQGNIMPKQPRFHLGADGYLKSTIPDLINYMEFLLAKENLVAKEAWKQLSRKTAPLGYFWHIENDENTTIYKHSGTAIGTTSWLIICPKYGIGISVLINCRFSNSSDIVYNTIKHLLKDIQLLTDASQDRN